MTTIAASIAAYGLIDRRKYLIASYSAMQSSLEQILGLDDDDPDELRRPRHDDRGPARSEHKAWLPQMLSTRPAGPAEPPKPALPNQ